LTSLSSLTCLSCGAASGAAGGPTSRSTRRTASTAGSTSSTAAAEGTVRIRHPEGTDRVEVVIHKGTTHRVIDVEVEVDPDLFEELVADGDEPDFNRHLQVLQTAELFQQVWRRVIGGRHRYPQELPFRPYLLQIAHHCFVEHLKRRPRDGKEQGVSAPLDGAGSLGEALAALAPDQREAVVLQQEAGFDTAAIAAVIGIEREVVHARLGQAVARLRQAVPAGGTA